MKVRLWLVLLIPFVALPVCAAEIRIGTGVSVANEILKPIEVAFEQKTGHKLIVVECGPDAALNALKTGKVDAAGIIYTSKEIDDLLQKSKQAYASSFFHREELGESRLLIVLNKNNPVKSLTRQQLRGLLTGKIANWKDVGGADLAVLTVLGNKAQGINEYYRKKVLEGEAFARGLVDADTGSQVRATVAIYDGGIGIVTGNLIDNTVSVPEQPEIKFKMYLYTKGKPEAKVRDLLSYIKHAIR